MYFIKILLNISKVEVCHHDVDVKHTSLLYLLWYMYICINAYYHDVIKCMYRKTKYPNASSFMIYITC